jgi:hypothetical protein
MKIYQLEGLTGIRGLILQNFTPLVFIIEKKVNLKSKIRYKVFC